MTTQTQPPGCDEVRMAVLARLDGEQAGLTSEEVDAHSASCGACQASSCRFQGVARRARSRGLRASRPGFVADGAAAARSRRVVSSGRERCASRADGCARRVATRPAVARVARAGHQFDRATRAHRGGASLAYGRSICHSDFFTFATAGRCVMKQTDSNVVLAQRYAFYTHSCAGRGSLELREPVRL